MSKKLPTKEELRQEFIKAGYVDPKAKWYWDKKEKAYCLPLKPIVLSEDELPATINKPEE